MQQETVNQDVCAGFDMLPLKMSAFSHTCRFHSTHTPVNHQLPKECSPTFSFGSIHQTSTLFSQKQGSKTCRTYFSRNKEGPRCQGKVVIISTSFHLICGEIIASACPWAGPFPSHCCPRRLANDKVPSTSMGVYPQL